MSPRPVPGRGPLFRAIAELWLDPGRGERVMLPPLLRGVRLTFGLWLGMPFERTAGLLLRATLPLWLRLTWGALWLRLTRGVLWLRLTCGARLRLTCALRLTWGALWLRLTRGALWLRLTWGLRLLFRGADIFVLGPLCPEGARCSVRGEWEDPPPERRFWPCASNEVVHIIAMQSISTTSVNLFMIVWVFRSC